MGCDFGLFKPREAAEDLKIITNRLTVAMDHLLRDSSIYAYLAPQTPLDDIPEKTPNPIISNKDFIAFLSAYENLYRALAHPKISAAGAKRRDIRLTITLKTIAATLTTVLQENPSIAEKNLKEILTLLSNHFESKFNNTFTIHPKLRTALYVAVAVLAFAAFVTSLVFLPFIHLAVLPAVAIGVGALLVTSGSGYGYYREMKKKETQLGEAKLSLQEHVGNFLNASRKMIV